tara:strand:- start:69 stop:695 length:627 start_codon:yes stop_codon:yes gene_type:complete
MTKYLKTKPGSLEDNYQQMFKKELEKSGKSLGSMSDQEKKNFFNKIDKKHKAKNEDLDENMSKAEKEKRLQRAKDMIKYYNAAKKQALKGPHKDLAKKMLKNDVEEAVDPETINNMRDKITKLNDKINTLNKGNPENQSKIAVMQADIEATKLKMRELQKKDAEDRTKTDTAEEVEGEKKMKYKEMKKKTMTDKPKTPVDVNPSVEYK